MARTPKAPKTNKPVKGILKRARITKSGKVRFSKTGKQKLNGHERGIKLQKKRGYVFATGHSAKMLSKQLHQRVRPAEAEDNTAPA